MSMVEPEILTRIISPDDPSLARQVAGAILSLGFKPADKQRMDALAILFPCSNPKPAVPWPPREAIPFSHLRPAHWGNTFPP